MDVLQRMGPAVVAPGTPGGAHGAFTRCVGATRADASAVRRDFRDWLATLADPDAVDDLTLAVYEALANVVDHAYASGAGAGQMRLWAAVSPPLTGGRDLVVTVSDDGSWRTGQGPGWRGRGLPLMHTLADASVISGVSGTTVQLRRRVAPAPVLVPA